MAVHANGSRNDTPLRCEECERRRSAGRAAAHRKVIRGRLSCGTFCRAILARRRTFEERQPSRFILSSP
jgi:hypothetical protein